MLLTSSTLSRARREASTGTTSLSHSLLERGGFVSSSASGLHTWLPLGKRVLDAVTGVVRSEMEALGEEVLLPVLQSRALWDSSGRLDVYGNEMMRLCDRRGAELCLGPTAEEAVTALVASQVSSYRDLPLVAWQVQVKFRDELRPRAGLVRAREFLMKDAYSFHLTEGDLAERYALFVAAYERVLTRLGVSFVRVAADSGEMGGGVSEEFLATSRDGEDSFSSCTACGAVLGGAISCCTGCGGVVEVSRAVEVAHVFELGTRYSQALGLFVTDTSGARVPVQMGCYGIGLSRLVAVLADQHATTSGVVWPDVVAPADVHVVSVGGPDRLGAARTLGLDLEAAGLRVVLEDRRVRLGAALTDAELLGARWVVVVGRDLDAGLVELRHRRSGTVLLSPLDQVLARVR